MEELTKAASKFIHFERVWRMTDDTCAAESMVFWRNKMSDLLTEYEKSA
jgi:hypothetical protein